MEMFAFFNARFSFFFPESEILNRFLFSVNSPIEYHS